MMEFLQKLYAYREQRGVKIKVFINREALGSSAILPFIADEISITPTAAWVKRSRLFVN